jgi:hypothetical protein
METNKELIADSSEKTINTDLIVFDGLEKTSQAQKIRIFSQVDEEGKKDDTLEKILAQIDVSARALVPDLSTQKGRDQIRSNAANVAKAKVRIDNARIALVTELKAIPKLIDASGKQMRDRLDALRDKVRQPLTDWEAEQEAIEAAAKEAARIEAEKAEAERVFLKDWEAAMLDNERLDFEAEKAALRAEQEKIEAKRLADEKAEAERLAIIQAEKDKAEREAKIAEEAIEAERARQKAAQEKAEADKLAAEKLAELAIENARLEKIAAAQAAADLAAKVEAERLAAIEAARLEKVAAEQAAIKLAEMVEANRLKAIEDARIAQELADKRAEENRLMAIENERKRIEAEQARQKSIDDAKAADLEHRKTVNNAIKTALVDNGFAEDDAVKIIKLAVSGALGALKVIY